MPSHQASLGLGLIAVLGVQCVLALPGVAQGPLDPRLPYSGPQTPPAQVPYSNLPGPPQQPRPAFRPDGWPTSVVSDVAPAGQQGPAQEQMLHSAPVMVPINDVQVLATVWSDPILASDVMPQVNDLFAANKDQVPPERHEELRNMLIQQRLAKLIETKILYNDAKRTIPEENIKNIQSRVFEAFEKQELPKMMKKSNCSSRAELNDKLLAIGSSLDREKQSYFERTLAEQWLLQHVKADSIGEIRHDEMLAWYHEHIAEYETPPRARWQQLTARFGDGREKGEAYRLIAQMGNMVLDGVPFAEVAKRHSEGITAHNGGYRDWTTKGSLVSKPLDQALFNQEVGKLSFPPIEDEQGFHIIVVLERTETTRVPFTEAQVEIKEKIKKKRQQEKVAEFVTKVKKQTPVWTVFDNKNEQVSERPGPVSR